MEYRTWITEALRLHFEEHLPRVVAGRRLGVPKSTVCSMFVRFCKAGLSWPLPAGMSERELDARLYGSASTVPVVLTESTVMPELPGVRKRPRRPNFLYEFKIALVEQSLQPGACVAQIARENGINDNLLFNWRHQYRKGGLLPSGKNMPALLPVTLTPEPDNKIPAPVQVEQTDTPSDSLCCDLVLPAGTLRLKGKLTPALLQTLIREMKGSSH
ncbi:IS66 family transposase orfA [Salmonella enterica]|uniref:IS66 family transposase orfA n=1 Tax=Salmonella enterica TaxID=28901 RepID=A0A7D8IKI7_SALER|nr:IS66 family transposase orfA [Salmonella enterica]